MKTRIVVIGGGVAGMSLAQELAERSGGAAEFDIHVYEKRHTTVGGKARSIPVPDSGTDGRDDLPGEHGFRFFPGFYRHLPDTMSRIPYKDGLSVFDNLVIADRLELARQGETPVVLASCFPRSLADLEVDFAALFSDLGLWPGEIEFFAARIWQILTSCDARRLAEYEKITWNAYLDGDNHSPAFQKFFVSGLSRSLLANDPVLASTRTVGDTNVQLLLGMAEPGRATDRLLNGPTSKVWIDPWRVYLEGLGVTFHLGLGARRIDVEGGAVTGVHVTDGATDTLVTGDAYVFALPVEKMARLLRRSQAGPLQDPAAVDPGLSGIQSLAGDVRWMNGIQFFLFTDVPIVHGHTLFVDSPWSVTSISESQFWSQEHLAGSGDGTVNGVLSACISEWHTKGILYGLPACECTRDQIAEEVWAQIKAAVNVGGKVILRDEDRHSWFLDPDIRELEGRGVEYHDTEPLFINETDTWRLRPEARTRIPNMFLASDYLQTYTDVACMEAANEAARRAVNALLDFSGSDAGRCALWPLHEPLIFAPFRWHDQSRFDQGLPWDGGL